MTIAEDCHVVETFWLTKVARGKFASVERHEPQVAHSWRHVAAQVAALGQLGIRFLLGRPFPLCRAAKREHLGPDGVFSSRIWLLCSTCVASGLAEGCQTRWELATEGFRVRFW